MKRMAHKVVCSVMAGLLIATIAVSWAPAYAEEETPGGSKPEGNPDERLARLYAREQEWLGAQEERLERAGELQARAEEKLAAMKDAGKDTSLLEAALESAEELVGEAQEAHKEAAKILQAGKGFDRDGKVTDREQARETVFEAGKALRQAQVKLREAAREVLQALRQYRREQRGES
jgi:hypothetical protein